MGLLCSFNPIASGRFVRLRQSGAVVLVLLLMSSAVPLLIPSVSSDPVIVDDGDMTRSVLWNLTDATDYNLYNASVSGGFGRLEQINETTGENSTDEYLMGTQVNVDLASFPNSMAIDNTSLTTQTVVLQPGPADGIDCYLDEWFPYWTPQDGQDLVLNTNYDPDPVSSKQDRIVMAFGFSSIPAGATVNKATLSLYERAGRVPVVEYTIHALEASWDEHYVSWRTNDSLHSWMNRGGDFSAEPFAWGTVDGTSGWHDFDLTRLVDLWVRQTIPNYGFIIVPKPVLGVDQQKTFVDSEITNKPDQRPKLTITYTQGEAAATYESIALGPGTNSTFTLASWEEGIASRASDEFSGSYSPRWNWTNDPSSLDGAINFDRSGWLNITGSTWTNLPNLTEGCNFLHQNITGNFSAETSLETYFSVDTMGAGLMAMSDALTWIGIYATGPRGDQHVLAQVSKGGVVSTLASIPWSNPSIFLRINRSDSNYLFSTSENGVDWNLLTAYSPQYDLTLAVSLGIFAFSNGSAECPVVEFDYVRVLPLDQMLTLDVSARTGSSTVLTDPSWGAWGPALSPSSGAIVGSAGKYIQYRISFGTSREWVSPLFAGFECHYETFCMNGSVTTISVTPRSILSWETMSITQTLAGGDVIYYYSTDNGGSWTVLGSGSSFSLVSVVQPSLKIRAEITTTDTSVTPSIDSIEVVYRITHASFYVSAPSSVEAGASFTLYIEAKDTNNNTAAWTGTVDIQALDSSGTGPASSQLSVVQGLVPVSGQLTISDQSYDIAETIVISVSGGGATGLSEPITVVPGPPSQVMIEPNITRMLPNSYAVFNASMCDAFGNPIPGTTIAWQADASLGILNTTTGPSVNLTAVDTESSGYLRATAGTITESLFIVVSALFLPPQINPDIPVQSKLEDYGTWTLDIGPFVSDREDMNSELRWYTLNETYVKVSGENRTGDLTITFTTVQDMNGINIVELWVFDSDRMGSKAYITVDITPVNDPPKIEPIDQIVVRYDDPYQYDLEFYVSDVETPQSMLSLWVDVASATYVQIAGLWITFLYPEAMNGTEQTVFLSVSDGEYIVSTLIQVTVTEDQVPRTLGPLPDLNMLQGEIKRGVLDLTSYFFDPDGTNLYYTNENTHVGVVIQANHTVDCYAPNNWAGQEYVIFIARDDWGARVEAPMRVIVTAVNDAPGISGVPNLVVKGGEPYIIDLAPYISDIDDELGSLAVTVSDPHAWTMGTLLSMVFPTTMIGTLNPLVITVSDGSLTGNCTIQVTVSSDWPPEVIGAPPDHTFLEDEPIDYPVLGHIDDFFTDKDGDQLGFSAFVSVPNVTAEVVADGSNWSIHFSPELNWFGFARLTFRAQDGEAAIAEETVLLNIVSDPDEPALDLPGSVTATQGSRSMFEFSRNATDPDSGAADFRWSLQCTYPEYVTVHAGVVVIDFPADFLQKNEESREITVTVSVTDQDNLVGSDTMIVIVQKNTVFTKQSPLLWVGLFGSAAAATVLSAYVIARRRKPFVVHDMMLIHNDGFLISRLAHKMAAEIDDNILSGMLTAVLNFVEDSMATSTETLKTFGFEDYQVLVRRGRRVFAAVVFEGDLPADIDDKLKAFLGTVEKVYNKKLETWTGDIETDFAGVEVLIHSWVKENSRAHGDLKAEAAWMHEAAAPKEPA